MSLFASGSLGNAYATGNIEQQRIEATYQRHDIKNNDVPTARKWSLLAQSFQGHLQEDFDDTFG